MGIFDYLTLGIPRWLPKLLFGAVDFLGKFWIPGFIVALVPLGLGFLVELVSLIARFATSVIATVAFSPLVLVTHIISSLVGFKQNEAAHRLETSNARRLTDYLTTFKLHPYDLRLSQVDATTDNEGTRKILLSLSPKPKRQRADQVLPDPFVLTVAVPNQQRPGQSQIVEGSPNRQALEPSVQAVLDLNMFKVSSRLKEDIRKITIGETTTVDEVRQVLGL